ncbi:YbbR-like domain-containing protein [Lentibacillus sediminis]|uniref:CdaR family protein n=1 Tax=Lentibacillus sediminis TaxID=1940529 RepID=UPI000C1C69B4|nr:CdaR family protein [Lentibacillus sediminis]
MDNWFNSKWFVRVISLVFAVLLYVFVSVEINNTENNDDNAAPGNSDEMQTLEEVPVNIRIDSENYIVSGVPETVSVTLGGTTGILTATVIQQNFDVYVDLQGLEAGEHTVEIQHDINNDLEVYIEPKTIEVTIEERASEEFQVTADFFNEDQMADGYELGEYQVTPETVTITSSQRVIDRIGMVKVYVNLDGVGDAINNREVPVNVYDSQGNELNVQVEPENVEVSAEVENPSKTVPVSVATTGELPEGYEVSSITSGTEEVEIFARTSILEGIEEVTTEEIDLSEVTESGTIEASLALPDGVSVPEMENIEVAIELEQTRIFENVGIEAEPPEAGQDVNFIDPETGEMDFTVTGNQAVVSELAAEDFQIAVNLDGLGAGQHQLPVTIEGPDQENLTVEEAQEQVTIEISE